MAPGRPRGQRNVNVNQGEQAPLNEQVPHDNNAPVDEEVQVEVPVVDVNAALAQMSNAIAMQAGRNAPNQAPRIRDFTRMNPPEFYGSKPNEDPQDFIEEIYKIVDIMGVATSVKAELAAYQLKGIAQIWFNQWKASRALDDGPITWEDFKVAFLDHYFPMELREAKMREFLNLKQGGMSVRDYVLRFSKLSKYAPTMMEDPRVKMGQFVSGLGDTVGSEGQAALLHKEMDLSRLMTYVEQVEDRKHRERRMRELKRPRVDGGFNKNVKNNQGGGQRANVPYKGKGKQKVHNNQDLITCAKCGKNHKGECLLGMGVCYRCGKPGHHIRDCRVKDPNPQAQGAPKGQAAPIVQGGQGQPRGGQAPRNNRFYALHGRQEVEDTPDVVTGMLQVFNFDVYALLDPGANLSFVSPYISMKFSIDPAILLEPYSVNNLVGESIVASRVFRGCPISILHRVIPCDLVELEMVDLNIIDRKSVV